jgi:hypothetical protein
MIRNSLLFFYGFILLSCSDVKTTETYFSELDTYFKNNHNFDSLSFYHYLVVINEQGDCLNCNNKFSKAMAKNVSDKNVLFLIATSGINVDISPYLGKEEEKNILFDLNNDFKKLNLINHSAIFKLEHNKVDTIVEIDVSNVDSSPSFIFK